MGKRLPLAQRLANALADVPKGAVIHSSYFQPFGLRKNVLFNYGKAGTLYSPGMSIFMRPGDVPTIEAGTNTMFVNYGGRFWFGGISSLHAQGLALDAAKDDPVTALFAKPEVYRMSSWFQRCFRGTYRIVPYGFLPEDICRPFLLGEWLPPAVSPPERAILEAVSDVPDNLSAAEVFKAISSLGSLNPIRLQSLLERCTSDKVKRLFLLLASDAKMPWFKRIDLSRVTYGRDCLVIDRDGALDTRYSLIVRPWRTHGK